MTSLPETLQITVLLVLQLGSPYPEVTRLLWAGALIRTPPCKHTLRTGFSTENVLRTYPTFGGCMKRSPTLLSPFTIPHLDRSPPGPRTAKSRTGPDSPPACNKSTGTTHLRPVIHLSHFTVESFQAGGAVMPFEDYDDLPCKTLALVTSPRPRPPPQYMKRRDRRRRRITSWLRGD
ncbi:unnamed protein product [Somion occarium]|uniref:Uncharacterized protein n=1 Tax=Somion occarium TaxID=3059160 RepID=A0ABP1EB99_9APHY